MERKDKIFWVIFLMTLVVLIAIVFFNIGTLNSFIKSYLNIYGYPAVFVFSALSNSFDQPIGPDAVAVAGRLVGLDVLYVFIFAVAGTWFMDILNYNLGKRVFSERVKASCSTKKYNNYCKLFFKYGRFALLISALLPIPEIFMEWLAGAFHMNKRDFFFCAMLPKAFRIGLVLLGVSLILFFWA